MIIDRFKTGYGLSSLDAKSLAYISKFYINPKELLKIKQRIFSNQVFPENVFHNNCIFIADLGGLLLTQFKYEAIHKIMRYFGEKMLYVIEDDMSISDDSKLCFQFNNDVQWSELVAGGVFSDQLFQRPIRNYYLFSDSGSWGNYMANDHYDDSINMAGTPLDILGFDKKHTDFLSQLLPLNLADKETIKKWLPSEYLEKWICKD